MSEQPKRRAEDRATEGSTPATEQPDNRTQTRRNRRSSDFFQKMKKPLIGLGIAGAAMPMIQAGEPAELSKETETNIAPATDPATASVAGVNLEETIANKIGEAVAVSDRDTLVNSAIERYDIERDLAEDIYDIATESGIEPKLAYGLVKTESTFNPRAVSHVGARGLTQVMPRTARWLKPGTRTEDLYDTKTNLTLGFKYLNQLIKKYDGDVDLALTAYNRGPGTVDKVLKRGGNPDNGYAGKVTKG